MFISGSLELSVCDGLDDREVLSWSEPAKIMPWKYQSLYTLISDMDYQSDSYLTSL